VTGAVQHHCDIQTHSISSLLGTITHLTPGTQPRQEPRQPDPATYRQPGNPATRQPGNPATRQHPAAPGSTWILEVPPHRLSLAAPGSTRQHPAAPGSRPGSRPGKPGTRQHSATRQTPGNTPATRQPDPVTPGNPATRHQGSQMFMFHVRYYTYSATYPLCETPSEDIIPRRRITLWRYPPRAICNKFSPITSFNSH
jgi:hypothetical protein